MTLFSILLLASTVGVALSTVGYAMNTAPGIISTVLLFSLPVLWVGWIVLAVTPGNRPTGKVILAWVAVDCFALALVVFLFSGLSHTPGPQGGDVALAIAFSPVIWPMILVAAVLPVNALADLLTSLQFWLNWPEPLYYWFAMSLLSSVPSLTIVALAKAAANFSPRGTSNMRVGPGSP